VILTPAPSIATLARADDFVARRVGAVGRVLGWGASSQELLSQMQAAERVLCGDDGSILRGQPGPIETAAMARSEATSSSAAVADSESADQVADSQSPSQVADSQSQSDEGAFEAVVTREPDLSSSGPWTDGRVARMLRDDGRFGMHLPPAALAASGGWDELSRRLADAALWPMGRLLIRQAPFAYQPLRVRPAQLMALGSYGVLVGERITRAAFRMRQAIRISLEQTGGARVTVVSGSMAPTYHVGEQVEVRRCTRAHRGDVILFERGSQLVLHRVLGRVGGYLVQRGDAKRERASLMRDWRVIACVVERA